MAGSPAQLLREAVWGRSATRLSRHQVVKHPVKGAYRVLARAALVGPPPKVFANSIPKSGTHLLSQLLGSVPRLWWSGRFLNHRDFRADAVVAGDRLGALDVDRLAAALGTVRNGQFVTAHVAWDARLPERLAAEGFVGLFMIRDPRDLVVSLAHYLSSREYLSGHRELAAMTPDERLLAVIEGLPATSRTGQEVPSIGERLARYRGWLTDPGTCVVRFEDLVGPRGGGTERAQRAAVRQVLEVCRRPSDDAAVDRLAGNVFSPHARTFRRGAIGEWRQVFTPEHEAAFTRVAGEAAAALGYG